ncbi:O-antigen ligase family protein [Parasulfitobacter algicola]|uniref:O-antigen ligase family protein n=1 Tax=Parasulfitobacter algicola TaxID=2614809 RepID=UPI001FE439A5|nr:O-antigen ligase family protein [Sulfitobacter algicola]
MTERFHLQDPLAFRSRPFSYVFVVLGIALYSNSLDRMLSGNPSHYGIVTSSLMVQLISVAFLGLSALVLMYKPKIGRPEVGTISIVCLTVWMALSLLWTSDPAHSFQKTISHLGIVLFAFATLKILTAEGVFRALVGSAMIFIFLQLMLMLLVPMYAFHNAWDFGVGEHAGRFRGSFYHKNETARILGLALLVLLTGHELIGKKWLWWMCVIAGTTMLFMSASAKLFMALPAVGMFFLCLKWRVGWGVKIVSAAYVALIGAVLFQVLDGLILIEHLVGLTGRDLSLSGRDAIWAVGWPLVADSPWLGHGYDVGWTQSAKDALYMIKGPSAVVNHAHNGYLQTLLDLGLVGLILVLIAPFKMMVQCMNNQLDNPRSNSVALIVSYVLVLNVTGSYLTQNGDLFMCLMIWSLAFLQGVQKDNRGKPALFFRRSDPNRILTVGQTNLLRRAV